MEFVDWDAEEDPFPPEPLDWEPSTWEEKKALDELFDDLAPGDDAGDGEETQSHPSSTSVAESHESQDSQASNEKRGSTKRKRGRVKGSGRTANETEGERKERLAAACRRFRAKRKEEIQGLKERNDELESEREIYLNKIAELQTEAQALRNNGLVNLSKENELLRVEIRKYKRFIQTVVSAARNAPLVTDEEKVRLLRSGVDSAIGQVLGLSYTSAADPSWRQGNPGCLEGQHYFIKYQYLPLGSTPPSCKRVNIRMDYPCLQMPMDKAHDLLWAAWTNAEMLKHTFSDFFNAPLVASGVQDIQLTEVFPELNCETAHSWEKENIKVHRYEEMYEDTVRDMLVATASKECELFSSAFPSSMVLPEGTDVVSTLLKDGTSTNVKTVVTASSNTIQTYSEEFCPKVDGVSRIESPVIEGYVLAPVNESTCHCTYVGSFPCVEKGLLSFANELVDSDGNLTPAAQTLALINIKFINGALQPGLHEGFLQPPIDQGQQNQAT